MATKKQVQQLLADLDSAKVESILKNFPKKNFQDLTDEQIAQKVRATIVGKTAVNAVDANEETGDTSVVVPDSTVDTQSASAVNNNNAEENTSVVQQAKTKIQDAYRSITENPDGDINSAFSEISDIVKTDVTKKAASTLLAVAGTIGVGALVYANRTNIQNLFSQLGEKWTQGRNLFDFSNKYKISIGNTKVLAVCLGTSTATIDDFLRVCAPYGLTPSKVVDIWNENRDDKVTYINNGPLCRINGRNYANRPYYYEVFFKDPRIGQLVNLEI